jgi:cytoskeleton protein RodZ
MKMTGQILRENRERKNISINEVAIATKINMKTIQAIESGDVGSLPPKTFLRGFVKSYATFLGLDVESVLNTFHEEMGSTRPAPATEEKAETPPPQPRTKPSSQEANDAINPQASLAKRAGAFTIILVAVGLIVLVQKKMESYEKEAVVEKIPQNLSSLPKSPDASPTPAGAGGPSVTGGLMTIASEPTPVGSLNIMPLASATPTPTASPTPAATPTPTPTPSPTPKATPTPTPTPSPTPKATPTPTPTPSPTPKATPTPTPTSSPSPSPSPSPSATPKAAPVAKVQEVIIEALDAVDVQASIDDEPAKAIHLKGDQVQSIKAKKKIVLKISDGGAINLIVNGKERGVPGDLGKPMRVELP